MANNQGCYFNISGPPVLNYSEEMSWDFWDHANIKTQHYEGGGCTSFKVWFQCNNVAVILLPTAVWNYIVDLCAAQPVINSVFLWLSCALGIPGNILALLTVLSMPKSTGTFYVALLSASDLASIIIKAFIYLWFHYELPVDNIGCKMSSVIPGVVYTYANWVLILICFERFITIRYPLQKNVYFTIKRARFSAIFLGLAICPFYIFYWFLFEISPDGKSCRQVEPYKTFNTKVWTYVNTLLYSMLPSVLLFVLVGLIAYELRKIQIQRKSIMGVSKSKEDDATSGHAAIAKRQLRDQAKAERGITIMLFFAAVVFLIMTVPICLVVIIHALSKDTVTFARLYVAVAVCRGLALLSHAINFFVYVLSASRFRKHLVSLFTKRCCCSTFCSASASPHDPCQKTLEEFV